MGQEVAALSKSVLDAKTLAIFEAAVELFGAKDYSGTTMEEIALRAGIAKGTLFYRYKSKEKLMESLLLEGISTLLGHIDSISASSDVRSFVEVIFRSSYDFPSFTALLFAELWRNDRPWAKVTKEIASKLRSKVMEVFDPWTLGLDPIIVFSTISLSGLEAARPQGEEIGSIDETIVALCGAIERMTGTFSN
ncbi:MULTISPECIES: TetR/AcrR family transcriptional regulator [Acidithrix]|uniref:Biofilm operon icaADBC HTH-type negative transcriptional regulator IcaR n=1 Tax=Acidithrix ferrooxidans TaxID=1280514 RepID=A0A0D8HDU6_9ACTN|nr:MULTISPECIES: TetR/AcrR family transcriptional regulator [Acidithrix]KJF16054.1 biofilm operon icaADBC HTH-type negative transcriptional regulator IcaR [Acidithrix ferrooxidans]